MAELATPPTEGEIVHQGYGDNDGVEPFLRWAGGKRWLTDALAPLLRERLTAAPNGHLGGRYFEPFMGSGAMFFSVAPHRALLSDLNTDLVCAFRLVASRPRDLLATVWRLPVDEDTYYRVRSEDPKDELHRAARFIYLNRTCYGGIYRENKRGRFNTPYGGGSRNTTPLWERSLVANCASLLSAEGIEIEVLDFESSLKLAGEGDVVYCDPTYRAATRQQYDRYGALVYDWDDQVRLASEARAARERGALVVVSNTYCDEVRKLYAGAALYRVEKTKSVGHIPKDPARKREYIAVLDPLGRTTERFACVGAPETN